MRRRALLLLSLPAGLAAQTTPQRSAPIYRCGPDGRQLGDRPCGGDSVGSAQRFDEPSAADREATRQRAARDAQQAERLQKRREQQERQPAAAAQGLSAPAASAPPAAARRAGRKRKPQARKD